MLFIVLLILQKIYQLTECEIAKELSVAGAAWNVVVAFVGQN